MSPAVVTLANFLTLTAQLLFVFLSGAVYARIARPGDNLKAADKIIISHMAIPGQGPGLKRVLFTRLGVVGVNSPELVDVRIALNLRIFLVSSTGSFFVPVENLKLVRSELPLLRFSFLVRHVIDESSPLYDYSDQDLIDGDASFSLCVNAMERRSMNNIFYKMDYFAFSGGVVYDRDFEDMLILEKGETRYLDFNRLSLLKPLPKHLEEGD